jgi:hypothetical protein
MSHKIFTTFIILICISFSAKTDNTAFEVFKETEYLMDLKYQTEEKNSLLDKRNLINSKMEEIIKNSKDNDLLSKEAIKELSKLIEKYDTNYYYSLEYTSFLYQLIETNNISLIKYITSIVPNPIKNEIDKQVLDLYIWTNQLDNFIEILEQNDNNLEKEYWYSYYLKERIKTENIEKSIQEYININKLSEEKYVNELRNVLVERSLLLIDNNNFDKIVTLLKNQLDENNFTRLLYDVLYYNNYEATNDRLSTFTNYALNFKDQNNKDKILSLALKKYLDLDKPEKAEKIYNQLITIENQVDANKYYALYYISKMDFYKTEDYVNRIFNLQKNAKVYKIINDLINVVEQLKEEDIDPFITIYLKTSEFELDEIRKILKLYQLAERLYQNDFKKTAIELLDYITIKVENIDPSNFDSIEQSFYNLLNIGLDNVVFNTIEKIKNKELRNKYYFNALKYMSYHKLQLTALSSKQVLDLAKQSSSNFTKVDHYLIAFRFFNDKETKDIILKKIIDTIKLIKDIQVKDSYIIKIANECAQSNNYMEIEKIYLLASLDSTKDNLLEMLLVKYHQLLNYAKIEETIAKLKSNNKKCLELLKLIKLYSKLDMDVQVSDTLKELSANIPLIVNEKDSEIVITNLIVQHIENNSIEDAKKALKYFKNKNTYNAHNATIKEYQIKNIKDPTLYRFMVINNMMKLSLENNPR